MNSTEQNSSRVEGIQAVRNELIGKRLTSCEKKILTLRYGIGISKEQTLAQVGSALRIKPHLVHSMEVTALKKLRTNPRVQHLRDYLTIGEDV